MPSRNPEKIIDQLWQSAENDPALQLHAILDTARDDRIYYKLLESGLEAFSLFRGEKARELATVAPYLVPLRRDEPFTQWLFTYGWGNSWGIIVESSADRVDPAGLKGHFQSLVMVYDEEGRPLYFRYYDPRVLRSYLPTCDEAQLRSFFGSVNSFYVEGEEPGVLIHYAFTGDRLVERKVGL